VAKRARDTSGFYGSLKLLQEQEAEFAKATGPFDQVVSDLRHFLDHGALPAQADTQDIAARVLKPSARFTKALATLDQMTAATPVAERRASAPVRFDRLKRDLDVMAKSHAFDTDAELVTKAHSHLMFNDGLNAAERGALMLGLSAAHERAFAKAQRAEGHPVSLDVEKIKASLAQAQRERDITGDAAVYLTEALRHLEGGIRDQDDRNRLLGLLQQLKMALAAGDEGAL